MAPPGAERGSWPAAEPPRSSAPPPAPTMADDAWTADRRRRLSTAPDSRATPSGRPLPTSSPPPLSAVSEAAATPSDALDLVDRSRPSTGPGDLLSDVTRRFSLGDFAGALCAAELLLGAVPGDAEGQRYAEASRACLEQRWIARLGSLEGVPRVAIPAHELRYLGLDHRAGFVLAQVDGQLDFESILDIAAMPRLEALQTLAELMSAGVIALVSRAGRSSPSCPSK